MASAASAVFFAAVSFLALCKSHGLSTEHHEYVIVGAGPGGIQTAYSMAKQGLDFVVLERGPTVGSFMRQFPRYRKLISINKKYTGEGHPDYNLRHDWNSLLSDESKPLFTEYTDEYWPHADLIPRYLADFASEHDLEKYLRFSTNVTQIRKEGGSSNPDGSFVIFADVAGSQRRFSCDVLIMATGRSVPETLSWAGAEHFETYNSMSTDPSAYRNKTVLIIGGGNSAFETADALSSTAAFVHVYTRSLRLAYQTHYVGDLRATNLEMFDRYLLKSQDALILRPSDKNRSVVGPEALTFRQRDDGSFEWTLAGDPQTQRLPLHRRTYDHIISCIGFKPDMSMFDSSIRPELSKSGRWVRLTTAYESVNVKNVFFVGNLGHFRDYRQSSGGFIHGFRYIANLLPRVISLRRQGWDNAPWPSSNAPCEARAITEFLFMRIQSVSSMYQMVGYLGDVLFLSSDACSALKRCSLKYFKDVPQELLRSGVVNFGGNQAVSYLTLTMEYNPYFHGEGVLRHVRSAQPPVVPTDIGEEDVRFSQTFGGPFGVDTVTSTMPSDEVAGVAEQEDRPWHWRAAAATHGVVSSFLHPVLRIWRRAKGAQVPELMAAHHVMEDLHTLWELESTYIDPALEFITQHLPSCLEAV